MIGLMVEWWMGQTSELFLTSTKPVWAGSGASAGGGGGDTHQ